MAHQHLCKFILCLLIGSGVISFGLGFRPIRSRSAKQRFCTPGQGRQWQYHNRGQLETVSHTALLAEKIKFKNFEQVLDCFHGEPIIIYFSTPHCGPCQLMKKELKKVQTHVGDMKMFHIDTEKWPHVASRLEVATLPCLVLFCEGEIKMRLEGVTPAQSIIERLDAFLKR